MFPKRFTFPLAVGSQVSSLEKEKLKKTLLATPVLSSKAIQLLPTYSSNFKPIVSQFHGRICIPLRLHLPRKQCSIVWACELARPRARTRSSAREPGRSSKRGEASDGIVRTLFPIPLSTVDRGNLMHHKRTAAEFDEFAPSRACSPS